MENDRSGGNVLSMVMAGGRGERLFPLIQERTTQSKSQSFIDHLAAGWRLSDFLQDRFVEAVPAQMRIGDGWYDKHNVIAARTDIGVNLARDQECFIVSDEDIVVVKRGDLNISETPLVPNTSHSYLAEL